MEALLQNIIEENLKNDNIDKKEILVIGDIKDYRDRMSKNFIRFIDYLRDNLINYKIIYYGTGIPEFIKGLSLLDIIKKYCQTVDPIVWICDVRGPTMTNRIYDYQGIKIYDYEDIMGKIDSIISEINNGGYSHVLYKNDGTENLKIRLNCPIVKFIRYDHYIDESKFTDYNLDKEYDILCFGCINFGCYPFRERLFKLLQKTKDIKTYTLSHPNYGYKKTHNIVEDNLSKLINKCKLSIVTPSTYEFFLKKYVEIALSKSCMVGRLPQYNGEKFKGCMIEVHEKMSDNEILDKIRYYLKNDKEREELVEKSYKVAIEYYSYEAGSKLFESYFNNIYKEYDKKLDIGQEKILEGRIDQIFVSYDLVNFREKFMRKYGLKYYYDRDKPLIFFGLYNQYDYHLIRNHRGLCVLIWGGTDSIMISEWKFDKILDIFTDELYKYNKIRLLLDKYKELKHRNVKQSLIKIVEIDKNINLEMIHDIPKVVYEILTRCNMRHIAISRDIQYDLDKLEINNRRTMITFVEKDKFKPCEKGNCVYIYTSKMCPNLYGEDIYKEVIERLPDIEFIIANISTYNNMYEVYKKCFIGLRLTKHDGNANTVQELGLCGIKCVHNGDYPNGIKWNTVEDILESIKKEREEIDKKDEELAKRVRDYIDINVDDIVMLNRY